MSDESVEQWHSMQGAKCWSALFQRQFPFIDLLIESAAGIKLSYSEDNETGWKLISIKPRKMQEKSRRSCKFLHIVPRTCACVCRDIDELSNRRLKNVQVHSRHYSTSAPTTRGGKTDAKRLVSCDILRSFFITRARRGSSTIHRWEHIASERLLTQNPIYCVHKRRCHES